MNSLDNNQDREETARAYIATWRKAYEQLLGADEPYTSRLIDHWRNWMPGGITDGGWFLHETPLSYIVRDLIPDDLTVELDGYALRQLGWEVESAITPPGDYLGRFMPNENPDYDWDAVRVRIKMVIDNRRKEIADKRH